MDVKQLRRSTELTQKEFCSYYGIPLRTLQNWESEKNNQNSRSCPSYVLKLLEKAVRADFPHSGKLLDANIDSLHLLALKVAKDNIKKSPLAPYVKDVLLYGSTARGTAKASSDIDLLLVLDEKVKSEKHYTDWINYLKGNISSSDFNVPEADLHIAFGDAWRENSNAFFTNVTQEGFSIWN